MLLVEDLISVFVTRLKKTRTWSRIAGRIERIDIFIRNAFKVDVGGGDAYIFNSGPVRTALRGILE